MGEKERKNLRKYEKISHKRNLMGFITKNSYLESKKKRNMLLQKREAVGLGLLFTFSWEMSFSMKNDAKTY